MSMLSEISKDVGAFTSVEAEEVRATTVQAINLSFPDGSLGVNGVVPVLTATGGAVVLPANAASFLPVTIAGVDYKLALFNV